MRGVGSLKVRPIVNHCLAAPGHVRPCQPSVTVLKHLLLEPVLHALYHRCGAFLKTPAPLCPHFSCGCRLGKYLQVIVGLAKILYLENRGTKLFSEMASYLALLVISLACIVVNTQAQSSNQKPGFGQTFDEIVVSSDLNVRRKSKEHRQGKRLLSNVPSGTTGSPAKPTAVASKLVSSDGSRVTSERREKRGIVTLQRRYMDLGVAGYLLKSRKR
ncbi:hypothetical protein KM043_017003 [Ampulex compressa]|nr:hypothetical protein KM043_017003 [Ampulex compressa]